MTNGTKFSYGHLGLAVGLTLAAGASVSRALTTDEFNGAAGAPNSTVWHVVSGGSPADSVKLDGTGNLAITADTAADLNTCSSFNYQAPFLWQKVLPGEAWTIEAKYNGPVPGTMSAYQWLQNIGIVGMAGTGSGVSTDAVQITQYAWNTGSTTIGSPGAATWNFVGGTSPMYFRLSDDGAGKLTPSYSLNGITYTPIGNYTQPNLYGIGLFGVNYFSANPSNGTLFTPTFDYFRVLSDTAPVPEPASLSVCGAGLAGLMLYRKRRGRTLGRH